MEATQTAAIDLQRFCAPSESYQVRLNLKSPWVMRGWKYATDARLCVRIPTDEPNTILSPETLPFPDAEFLFNDFDRALCAEPWPYAPYIQNDGPCPDCEGAGEFEKLDGSADQCAACGGKGRRRQDDYRIVGVHHVAVRLDKLIIGLPGVKWEKNHSPTRPLRFVFDGGEGAVMGKTYDK